MSPKLTAPIFLNLNPGPQAISPHLQQVIAIALLLVTGMALGANPAPPKPAAQFRGNLTVVLGDVKQAFIKKKITRSKQIDVLLKGFKTMGVTGIRVPIFAEGRYPNQKICDEFIRKANQQGFKIFANPAITSGGACIVNGVVEQAPGYDPAVKLKKPRGNDAMTKDLIRTIQRFAQTHTCHWISPFNEDGPPGREWSIDQMNEIYRTLHGTVNGSILVGPDTWGVPSGIKCLKQTDLTKYIGVAGTHNLGFNHASWPTFIKIAKSKKLTVWDSETNYNDKKGNGTRIEAAIAAGVDGIVLYDSWNWIHPSNGTIKKKFHPILDLYKKSPSASRGF